MKKSVIALAVIGVLIAIFGILLEWAIVPAILENEVAKVRFNFVNEFIKKQIIITNRNEMKDKNKILQNCNPNCNVKYSFCFLF